MNETVAQYLVSKVLADFRGGQSIGDGLATSLHCYPTVDALREAVREEDVAVLMEMASSASLAVGNLAIDLLRKFDRDTQRRVRSFLLVVEGVHVL